MKIAITGHTSGIGKEINKLYPLAITFAKSTGNDINDAYEIARLSHDCDVFINNAHDGFAQVQLLYTMHNIWKHHFKVIICIASAESDIISDYPNPYSIHNCALEAACDQLNNMKETNCRIICVKPGKVDTPRSSKIKKQPKIKPSELATFIKMLIDMKDSMWVSKVVIQPS